MNNIVIETNDGDAVVTIEGKHGIIDGDAIMCFTRGHCHSFAVALHDVTGWPIFAIGGTEQTPYHFVIYDPVIKDYVDIQGTNALGYDGNDVNSKRFMKEMTREETLNRSYYRKADLDLAKPFVKTMLKNLPHKVKKLLTTKKSYGTLIQKGKVNV